MLANPKTIDEEKYKNYVALFTGLKPVLNRITIDWRRYKNYKENKEKIEKEIATAVMIMESTHQELSIEIKNIQ